MEDKTFQIPSASEKQGYKFLLDAAMARKRLHAAHQVQSQEELDLGMPEEQAPSTFAEALACEEGYAEAEPLAEEPNDELTPTGETRRVELTPDKNYFRIGEVAHLLAVEPHVLRYWESEFSHIRPTKSGGQRVYNRKTVEALQQIHHLLYEEGFSITGARKRIKEDRREKRTTSEVVLAPSVPTEQMLQLAAIEKELRELIRFVEAN